MVTIEEAENIAVEFIMKRKKVDKNKIDVREITKNANWELKGSTPDEIFTVKVNDSREVVGFNFYSKQPKG